MIYILYLCTVMIIVEGTKKKEKKNVIERLNLDFINCFVFKYY